MQFDMAKGYASGIPNAIEIVKQAAIEYNKNNYYNLDNVTLHKCPVCGGTAQHRVNKRGSWACGCFKCKMFKFDYDHEKAIQKWEDFCADYNNGWIPCSEQMPEDGTAVLVKDFQGYYEISICETRNGVKGFLNGHWWSSANNYYIAWKPLPEPYQPKGE